MQWVKCTDSFPSPFRSARGHLPVGQPIPGCSADNLLQRWVQTAGKWTIPYFKWNFVPCDPFSENSCVDFHFSEGLGWKSCQRKRNSPGSKMCCIFIAGLFVSSPPCFWALWSNQLYSLQGSDYTAALGFLPQQPKSWTLIRPLRYSLEPAP